MRLAKSNVSKPALSAGFQREREKSSWQWSGADLAECNTLARPPRMTVFFQHYAGHQEIDLAVQARDGPTTVSEVGESYGAAFLPFPSPWVAGATFFAGSYLLVRTRRQSIWRGSTRGARIRTECVFPQRRDFNMTEYYTTGQERRARTQSRQSCAGLFTRACKCLFLMVSRKPTDFKGMLWTTRPRDVCLGSREIITALRQNCFLYAAGGATSPKRSPARY